MITPWSSFSFLSYKNLSLLNEMMKWNDVITQTKGSGFKVGKMPSGHLMFMRIIAVCVFAVHPFPDFFMNILA